MVTGAPCVVAGADHESATRRFPARAFSLLGADATSYGIAATAALGADAPIELSASILNQYRAPAVSRLMVTLAVRTIAAVENEWPFVERSTR